MKEKIEEMEAALQEKKGDGLLAKHLRADGPNDSMDPISLPESKEFDELSVKNKKLKKKLQQKDDKVKQLEHKVTYLGDEITKLEEINNK